MKQSRLWLLALLSILTLLATTAMANEDAGHAHVTGSWELGMSGISTEDNAARVNEYSSVRNDDGVSLAPKLELEIENGGFILELESETMGPRDQQHGLEIDAGRVFKFESELSVLEHHKDHETLDQMGATARDDIGGAQPSVVTDKTFADLAAAGFPTTVGGATGPANAAALYNQEINNNYIVTRREWKNEAELTIPQLPNVTIKAGARIETREGMEQAISLAKCKACHISASGKEIDERTEEFTIGATAKFGLLTVDYEYLTRNFEEQADPESRFYVTAGGNPQLLYSNVSDTEFGKTPDSEKDAHLVKARLDLPSNTSITASYVKADIESTKQAVTDSYAFVGDNTLDSEYEGFNAKVATILGPVRLSLRGGIYEIDGPEYKLNFPARDGFTNSSLDNPADYVSAESREVTEFGADAVYRLAKSTTLRLGYEYEEIERDEEELGETETHTFKVAVKSRINKTLSGHISYEYQDIDDPFGADHATGIAQLTGTPDSFGSGLVYVPTVKDATGKTLYWNDVYPARSFSATNQADEIHEAKLSTTWSPSTNMAATFFMRFRYEENDNVDYEQTTIVPGASFWYAPSDKLNLTMSYTFNNQDTENRSCVGWYHG